jgi:hypothetical protein
MGKPETVGTAVRVYKQIYEIYQIMERDGGKGIRRLDSLFQKYDKGDGNGERLYGLTLYQVAEIVVEVYGVFYDIRDEDGYNALSSSFIYVDIRSFSGRAFSFFAYAYDERGYELLGAMVRTEMSGDTEGVRLAGDTTGYDADHNEASVPLIVDSVADYRDRVISLNMRSVDNANVFSAQTVTVRHAFRFSVKLNASYNRYYLAFGDLNNPSAPLERAKMTVDWDGYGSNIQTVDGNVPSVSFAYSRYGASATVTVYSYSSGWIFPNSFAYSGYASVTGVYSAFPQSETRESFDMCLAGGTFTSVPEDLFAYNPNAWRFMQAFYNTSLEAAPAGLFANNPKAKTLSGLFSSSKRLKTVPAGIFDNCPDIESVESCFSGCAELIEAPRLWEIYPNMPYHSACYAGCTKLPWYDEIPADWK